MGLFPEYMGSGFFAEEVINKMLLLFFLLLQNFIQVIFSGWALAPDLFFLSVISQGITDERHFDRYLWGAFLGGLFLDLRWTGIPGFSASIYSALFLTFRFLWMTIPKEGRVPVLFLGFSSAVMGISAILRLLLFYSGRPMIGQAMVVFFLLTFFALLISCAYYARFYRGQDV